MTKNANLDSALNAICPYFTMFPLSFPYSILKRYGEVDDRIIDPFCGRGTTNFASRLVGLRSAGIDSSDVAVALTQAKIANTNASLILSAARRVLSEVQTPRVVPDGEFWELAYHPRVLKILCRMREGLIASCNTDSRRALRAIILGALHGPQPKTQDSYFSNQCPRTYAPKPNYAVSFWKSRNLRAHDVDVLDIIRKRALRYYENEATSGAGIIISGDSRERNTFKRLAHDGKFSWAITSPPYYGMTTYIADQWLRKWFVGGESHVDYSTTTQISHRSPDLFAADLRKVWINIGLVSKPGAKLVIRFGGINNRKADPLSILRSSLSDTDWKIQTIKSAGVPSKGRRQAETFTSVAKPVAEYDVWARLQ